MQRWCWASAAATRWTWGNSWPGSSKKPLVLIPTIVSTGAIFQAPVAIRRRDTWEFCFDTVAPDYLLLDYGVIAAAPPHLNRAGMGECICNLGHVASWRWWAEQGLEGLPPMDQAAADGTLSWIWQRCRQFSEGLDAQGQLNDAAIRIASEINRERYDVPTFDMKVSRSIDHTFVIAFEWVLGRELIHSEVVSLGSLINAHVYEWGFDETKALLDLCRVRYRPAEIGCTWDEVKTVIGSINELHDLLGNPPNWFHHHTLSDASFERWPRPSTRHSGKSAGGGGCSVRGEPVANGPAVGPRDVCDSSEPPRTRYGGERSFRSQSVASA